MSFDILGSMEAEVNGRGRGRGKRRRSNPNELGRLPVAQGSLENIFGGVRKNGNGKKGKGKRKSKSNDNGFMDMGNGLSSFGDSCLNCKPEKESAGVFSKGIGDEGLTGFDTGDLGGAFNGRFKNIGGGFIESVNAGKVGAIDFDAGAKGGDAISPVFRTGEGFGLKRGKLEAIASKEGRRRVGRPKKKRKGKAKSNGNGNGEEGERVIDVIKRKIKERKERQSAKGNGSSSNGFHTTSVGLGQGTPVEEKSNGNGNIIKSLPESRETPEPIRDVFRKEREDANRG